MAAPDDLLQIVTSLRVRQDDARNHIPVLNVIGSMGRYIVKGYHLHRPTDHLEPTPQLRCIAVHGEEAKLRAMQYSEFGGRR